MSRGSCGLISGSGADAIEARMVSTFQRNLQIPLQSVLAMFSDFHNWRGFCRSDYTLFVHYVDLALLNVLRISCCAFNQLALLGPGLLDLNYFFKLPHFPLFDPAFTVKPSIRLVYAMTRYRDRSMFVKELRWCGMIQSGKFWSIKLFQQNCVITQNQTLPVASKSIDIKLSPWSGSNCVIDRWWRAYHEKLWPANGQIV